MDEAYSGFVHGELKVYNNSFLKPLNGKHVFFLEYLKKADVYNNFFDAPFEIISKRCGDITTDNS